MAGTRKIYEHSNRTLIWRDYKAGVIESDSGREIVPCRFDEVEFRVQSFKAPYGVRPKPPVLIGFACFTNERESLALDVDGNPDEWRDWESSYLRQYTPPEKSIEEMEKEIREGYDRNEDYHKLNSLIWDRFHELNHQWQTTMENVSKISAVNNRLNAAVREALAMGEMLEKSLTKPWAMEIEIYPVFPEEDFRNILVELGSQPGRTGICPCFDIYCDYECPGVWDFKIATCDDGSSWDEGAFHLPAYQDLYFLRPFQRLHFDNTALAALDLIKISEFKIAVYITKSIGHDI